MLCELSVQDCVAFSDGETRLALLGDVRKHFQTQIMTMGFRDTPRYGCICLERSSEALLQMV